MSRSYAYDDRPEAVHLSLRLDEVEALVLNGGEVLTSRPGRVVHFLRRVVSTLREQGDRVTRLQHELERLRIERADAAHPVSRALDAIAALDDEQRRTVLDQGYLAELDKLRGAREQAELTSAAAQNEANRVRMALASILEDPAVGAEAKQRIRNALSTIGYRY